LKFDVCIKSRTSGHKDYDNCDLNIITIENCSIPNQDDIIKINYESYLVREIVRSYVNKSGEWCEYITVYVIKN
jgi:hypothetical protein